MKLVPEQWKEAKQNGEFIQGPKGRLRLLATAPVGLVLESEGVTVAAGHGSDFDITLAAPYRFCVVGEQADLVSYFDPHKAVIESEDESLTNIDKRPPLSEFAQEVQSARREIDMMLKQGRMELRQMQRSMKAQERRETIVGAENERLAAEAQAEADAQAEAKTAEKPEEKPDKKPAEKQEKA